MGTPREDLVELLKQARLASGYGSHAALARKLKVSRSVVTRAENPTYAVPTNDVLTAWAIVTGIGVDELVELAERIRSGTPEWFMPYKTQEAKADTLRYWSPMVIPGLFQTIPYMRVLFEDEGHLPDQVEQFVAARIERQVVIGRVQITAIMSEQALHRTVSSASIMAEQCAYLIQVAERSGVVLHIVPKGQNIGLWGACDIAARDGSVTVCLETIEDVTSTSPSLVRKVTRAYERILGAALPRAESLELIRMAEEEWKSRI